MKTFVDTDDPDIFYCKEDRLYWVAVVDLVSRQKELYPVSGYFEDSLEWKRRLKDV